MKTLRKLELLILTIIKTTPKVIKTYKQIYENIIAKENEIIEQSKKMIEADKHIKTTFVCEPKETTDRIRALFKRQKAEIKRFENYHIQKKIKGVN